MNRLSPNNQPHLVHPKYRADIDGLRAVAILSVIAYHAFPDRVKGGFVGVDVFFVISGFLISTIIFGSLGKGTFSFAEFYVRRIKRIFPALILVMAASYALGWFVLLPDEFKQLGKHIAAGAAFVANIFYWQEAGYFDRAAETKPLLHLWSLGIEEQFYIAWPLMLFLTWKRRFNFLFLTVTILAASFAVNVVKVQSDAVQAFYSPLSRFWELMLGSILAYLALHKISLWDGARNMIAAATGKPFFGNVPAHDSPALRNARSLIGTLMIGFAVFIVSRDRAFPGWWALLPTLGTYMVISAGPQAWLNRTVLSHPAAVWIGLISYPLYLWHWPLLAFARIMEWGTPAYGMRIAAIAISVALAWLTYRVIERPIRFGRNGKAKTIILLALMTLVGYAGYDCYHRDGLAFRLPKEIRSIIQPVNFRWSEFTREGECYIQDPSMVRHSLSCYEQTRPLLALWGDSHAASLYPGLKKLQSQQNFGLTQLTQSACGPIFGLTNLTFRKNCNEVNQEVFAALIKEQPDVLVLQAAWMHRDYPLSKEELSSKFTGTLNAIRQKLPATKIIVIGPLPKWQDSPQKVIFMSWKKSYDKTRMPDIMQKAETLDDIDILLKDISGNAGVQFISAIDNLCNIDGCISRVGDDPADLIAKDYGHLSRAGSEYFAEKIKNEIFSALAAAPLHEAQGSH